MRALVVLGCAAAACGPPVARPAPPRPVPVAAARRDPINTVDLRWLRDEAGRVLSILVAGLPPPQRARLAGVTLDAEGLPGEVNAYTACRGAAPFIVVSDDLLRIEAELASARATDERFGTDRMRAYVRLMAGHAGDERLGTPPAGFYDPAQRADGAKLVLQRAMFDEQIAYVVGHELAHHYLGHLRCEAGGAADDPARDLARIIPAFNQAAEIAADVAATRNLLAAGRPLGWSEEGALVLFDFLTRWDRPGIPDVLLAFARTHPFAQVRQPIVMSTADLWRLTHGVDDR